MGDTCQENNVHNAIYIIKKKKINVSFNQCWHFFIFVHSIITPLWSFISPLKMKPFNYCIIKHLMLMASHRHLTLHEKNTATSAVAVNPCTHSNNALHKVMSVYHLPASQTKDQNWYHFQSCTVLKKRQIYSAYT